MRRPVDDGERHHDAATGPVRPGEVMVTRLYHAVAFPAVLDSAHFGVIDHDHDHITLAGSEKELTARVRKSVAQWIGLHAETYFGDDAVRWEWRGTLLVIHDDLRDDHLRLRTVEPDTEGLYALTEPWFGMSDPMVARMARQHGDAIGTLAGDEPPSLLPAMLDYLSQPLLFRPDDVHQWMTEQNRSRLTAAITKFNEAQRTLA